MYSGVTTIELDNLAAETAASMTTKHPDYTILAARIAISNLHKQSKKLFSDVIEDLYNAKNDRTGVWEPLVSQETRDVVRANADVIIIFFLII